MIPKKIKTPGERWAGGIDHDPRSEKIVRRIAELDFEKNGDYFGFSIGGDGDNGEALMYLLDMYFEEQNEEN